MTSVMDKTCRICFCSEEEITNPLISPCQCRGTCQFIHRECLKQYRTYGSLRDFYRCGVCKTAYKMKKKLPFIARVVTSPLFLNVLTAMLVLVIVFFLSCIPVVEYPWRTFEGHVYNLGVFSVPLTLMLVVYTICNGAGGNLQPLDRVDRVYFDIHVGPERNIRRNGALPHDPGVWGYTPRCDRVDCCGSREEGCSISDEKVILGLILLTVTAMVIVICDRTFYLTESLVRYLVRNVHRVDDDVITNDDSS